MRRDLDVIEAVITEIVNSEFGGNTRLSSKRANASYVEGRGILIKIPSLNANSYAFGSNVIKIVTDGDDEERLVYNATSSSAPKSDEGKKEGEEALLVKLEKVMRTFLVNYGDLARDLPENEKIILLFKKHKTSSWSYKIGSGNATSIGYTNSSEEDDTLHQLSAEVLKSDISKLKAGKLNEDEFWQKVSIKKVSAKGSEKDKLEYNVLAKIFEGRLSQKGKEIKEQDDNVIIIGVSDWHKVDYEVVTGLGVVYNINVNMPFKSNIFIKGIINDKNKKEKLEELAEKAEEADEDRDEKLAVSLLYMQVLLFLIFLNWLSVLYSQDWVFCNISLSAFRIIDRCWFWLR